MDTVGTPVRFIEKPAWTARAKCSGQPHLTQKFYSAENNILMRQICSMCPVSTACLQYGFSNDEKGTWGGVFVDNYTVSLLIQRTEPQRLARYKPGLMRLNAVGIPVYGCPSCCSYETVVPDRRTYYCAHCNEHFRP